MTENFVNNISSLHIDLNLFLLDKQKISPVFGLTI